MAETTTAPADEEPKTENKSIIKPEDNKPQIPSWADKPLDLQHLSMNQLNHLGKVMAASGMFSDVRDASSAIVKILAGQEIGITPFQAMTNVHIIQGKATMGANLMAAKLKGSGKYDYRVTELSDESCSVEIFEYEHGKKQPIGDFTYSMENAKTQGLAAKDNWRKYPQAMLFARAISQAVRLYAPDIFSGSLVYTPDEMGAEEDDEGNLVVGSDSASKIAPPKQSSTPEPTTIESSKDRATPRVEVKAEPEIDLPSAAQVAEVKAKFKELGITKASEQTHFAEMYIGKKKPVSAYDFNNLSVELSAMIEEKEAANE